MGERRKREMRRIELVKMREEQRERGEEERKRDRVSGEMTEQRDEAIVDTDTILKRDESSLQPEQMQYPNNLHRFSTPFSGSCGSAVYFLSLLLLSVKMEFVSLLRRVITQLYMMDATASFHLLAVQLRLNNSKRFKWKSSYTIF